MIHFMYIISHFISFTGTYEPRIVLLAPNVSDFTAQLVKALHWHREVTGLNLVEVLNFSQAFLNSIQLCICHCEDHFVIY